MLVFSIDGLKNKVNHIDGSGKYLRMVFSEERQSKEFGPMPSAGRNEMEKEKRSGLMEWLGKVVNNLIPFLFIIVFPYFVLAAGQKISPTPGNNATPSSGVITDDQWFENISPYQMGGFLDNDLVVMQKQLGLNDEQIKSVKTFGDMIYQLNQSGKDEWYVESLKDRSNGKIESSPSQIKDAKNKWEEKRERIINYVHAFRGILGEKEPDFVLWIRDDAIIAVNVARISRKNPNLTAEEVAEKVLKDRLTSLDEKKIKNPNKYKNWIHDRACIRFYDFALQRVAILKDKVRSKKLIEERHRNWLKMLSNQ